ncbi:MAG: ribonuclease D [Gammaproteobacteria bacterium]|nr:ribonuclease D [Gammaproteobacteria bacterium]
MSYLYIETESALQELCAQLSHSNWITLDTEFIREESYYPQLCLVQVANEEVVACIDPIAITDLSPLHALLHNPKITKVLHAARQDLEIFWQLSGQVPAPIYDSQIAAALLGQGEQIGYGNLVQLMLNIELDKAHSRTDWSQRPLSPEQLEYAADDVRHLREIYKQQIVELEKLQRLPWLNEDFDLLTDTQLYDPPSEDSWRRIKGNQRLKGEQLAILQLLAKWREDLARERNRPRRWILADEVLIEICRLRPLSTDKLKRMRGLNDKKLQQYGQTIISLVEQAKRLPKGQWPILENRNKLNIQQEATLDVVQGMLKLCAHNHKISPNSLATRKELEAFMLQQESPLRHGWRHELCGQSIEKLLSGELCITIAEGKITTATG